MTRHQTPNVDLRRRYPVFMQIGLAASLGIVLLLFTVPISGSSEFEIVAEQQEIVFVQEIEQTRQIDRPPPAARPPAPIEVPNEAVETDVVLDLDMSLDLSEAIAPPPPPPPPPAPESEPEPVAPEPEEEIFVVVEQPPQLVGGLESVQARLKYPEVARLAGIEGTIHLQFVVDEQGNIRDPFCVRDLGGGLCEAALEAVKDAKFEPGRQRGRPVKVRFSIPVRFRLR